MWIRIKKSTFHQFHETFRTESQTWIQISTISSRIQIRILEQSAIRKSWLTTLAHSTSPSTGRILVVEANVIRILQEFRSKFQSKKLLISPNSSWNHDCLRRQIMAEPSVYVSAVLVWRQLVQQSRWPHYHASTSEKRPNGGTLRVLKSFCPIV